MLDAVKCRMRQLRDGVKVLRHYLRWPYPIYKPTKFDDFNHEHTCIAARFSNVELTEICPLTSQEILLPGSYDECETCRYFGTVYYQIDPESGKQQLHFGLDECVVTTCSPIK